MWCVFVAALVVVLCCASKFVLVVWVVLTIRSPGRGESSYEATRPRDLQMGFGSSETAALCIRLGRVDSELDSLRQAKRIGRTT